MRRRIQALAGAAGPAHTRGGPTSPGLGRAVGGISSARADRPAPAEPTGRASGDTFEWEMRNSDGPTDSALYACGCGYKFTARVATTVSCPNCGIGQAW